MTPTAIAFEGSRLRIPTSLLPAETLVEELANVKVKISAAGHDSYGASAGGDDWRDRPHDDLELAVAVACWYRDRPKPRRTVRFF